MRFLCLYKPGVDEDPQPSAEEREAMGKLIEEMSRAGVLLGVEGCMSSAHGARVGLDRGKVSVTDGPFPETKELIAGFCLMQVKTKAEAVEWTRRFLAVVGRGQSEIRQLCDQPAA